MWKEISQNNKMKKNYKNKKSTALQKMRSWKPQEITHKCVYTHVCIDTKFKIHLWSFLWKPEKGIY